MSSIVSAHKWKRCGHQMKKTKIPLINEFHSVCPQMETLWAPNAKN
jgi:hypothetical protein